MKFNPQNNHRILVIDDSEEIHALFRAILRSPSGLPDEREPHSQLPVFEIDSAYQGREGLDLIEKSLSENQPYALAFVDIRMPPGWDGLETICKIWEQYRDLQVVICSGYADHPWEELAQKLGNSDRVVVLNKPFDGIEVLQLAVAMTEKWRLNQQSKLRTDNLEKLVHSLRPR
jgi:CheY-like chemotaxis protein